MALVAKATPQLARKNFQLHVDLLRQGRRRPLSPLEPTYRSWCRIVPLLKTRLMYRAEIERGEEFNFATDADFVDREIQRLFYDSCPPALQKVRDSEIKFFFESLDPFILDSQVQDLFHEADTDRDGYVDAHDIRAAVIWALDKQQVMDRSMFTEFMQDIPRSAFYAKPTTAAHISPEGKDGRLLEKRSGTYHDDGMTNGAPQVGGHATDSEPRKGLTRAGPLRPGSSFLARISRVPTGTIAGGVATHKALALALSGNKVPLIRCLLRPDDALRKTRGELTEEEIAAAAAKEEEAKKLATALRMQEEADRIRMKIPSRDRNGRTTKRPTSTAGEVVRGAREVLCQDPRQVDTRLLLRTGASKTALRAFLAAKESKRAREAGQAPRRKEEEEEERRKEEEMTEGRKREEEDGTKSSQVCTGAAGEEDGEKMGEEKRGEHVASLIGDCEVKGKEVGEERTKGGGGGDLEGSMEGEVASSPRRRMQGATLEDGVGHGQQQQSGTSDAISCDSGGSRSRNAPVSVSLEHTQHHQQQPQPTGNSFSAPTQAEQQDLSSTWPLSSESAQQPQPQSQPQQQLQPYTANASATTRDSPPPPPPLAPPPGLSATLSFRREATPSRSPRGRSQSMKGAPPPPPPPKSPRVPPPPPPGR